MWHFQMRVLNNFISVWQCNYCTLKTKINQCVVIKVALNGIDTARATEKAHKSIKHSKSDNKPLNQPQSPLCKTLLYLILFFYFRFHIWDTMILPLGRQFALSHFNNQGSLMVGFSDHLRAEQLCLWKTLSRNGRAFSLPLSKIISEFCFNSCHWELKN